MWVLVQPAEPTFNAGGSIDKFLLVPRDYAPEDFLPPELGVVEDDAATPHYPAHA